MKTLIEYSKLIKDNLENPHNLSKIHLEISADYGYLSSILIPLKEKKPQVWINIKFSDGENKVSDKLADMKYLITDDGKLENGVEIKMKALEKMMASIKNNMYVLNQESKNQY